MDSIPLHKPHSYAIRITALNENFPGLSWEEGLVEKRKARILPCLSEETDSLGCFNRQGQGRWALGNIPEDAFLLS